MSVKDLASTPWTRYCLTSNDDSMWCATMADMQERARTDLDYADRLINEQEAAEFLGFSVRALQNWRLRGGGPNYVRVSRRSVRYRRRDLMRWADERVEAHTSASSPPANPESGGAAADAPSGEYEQGHSEVPSSPGAHPEPQPQKAKPRGLRTLLPHDRG